MPIEPYPWPRGRRSHPRHQRRNGRRASRWHCRDRRWPSGRSRRMGGAAAISVAMLGSASAAAALAGRSTQQLCNPCVYVHICGQAYHRPIGSFCLRGHALHRGQSPRVIRSRIRERRGEPIKSFASESRSLLTQRVSFQRLIGAAARAASVVTYCNKARAHLDNKSTALAVLSWSRLTSRWSTEGLSR